MPAPTKVQLTGGQFQDSEGNKLALGYLKMKLAMDANISGVGNIASGIEITIQLDANGSVVTSPAQSVWGVDQMLPANNYYRVTGYTEAGQPAWGPNNQQVVGNGGTFDVGTWVPNQVISWTPPLQALELDTNGTKNPNQGVLNFKDTASVTWSVDSSGNEQATAVTGPTIELQTNGVDNTSQSKLNLKNGTNISVTSDGSGGVTIANTQVIPPATPFSPAIRFTIPNWLTPANTQESPANSMNAQTTGIGSGTHTVVPATASVPSYRRNTSPASASNATYVNCNTANFYLHLLKNAQYRLNFFRNTFIRNWIGFGTDASPGIGNYENDALNFGFVGFRFSTNAGDTHWQAYAGTDNTHVTLADTGITPDNTGAQHIYEIRTVQGTPGTILFYIDGVQVASISTNVPSATTALAFIAGSESLTAGSSGDFGDNLISIEVFI